MGNFWFGIFSKDKLKHKNKIKKKIKAITNKVADSSTINSLLYPMEERLSEEVRVLFTDLFLINHETNSYQHNVDKHYSLIDKKRLLMVKLRQKQDELKEVRRHISVGLG